MLGYTRDDAELPNWQIPTPPQYLAQDMVRIEGLRRGDTPVPFEKEYIRRDGSSVAALVVAQFLPGEKARIGRIRGRYYGAQTRLNGVCARAEARLRMLIDHMAGFVRRCWTSRARCSRSAILH